MVGNLSEGTKRMWGIWGDHEVVGNLSEGTKRW